MIFLRFEMIDRLIFKRLSHDWRRLFKSTARRKTRWILFRTMEKTNGQFAGWQDQIYGKDGILRESIYLISGRSISIRRTISAPVMVR